MLLLKQGIKEPEPVNLDVIRFGHNVYLRIRTDRVDLAIAGKTQLMIQELNRLTELATPTNGIDLPGIERGDAEPEPQARQSFNLITLADIPEDDPTAAWPLIVARFPWLADVVPQQFQKQIEAESQSNAQLSADLKRVELLVGEIFDETGQLVWGAQSRIGEAIGVPNSGTTNRKRILDVVEALQGKEAA